MFKNAVFFLILFSLIGCAQVPVDKQDEKDPLQTINRPLYDFNMDVLDAYILRPAAVGYVAITPQPVRRGLVNLTENIGEPVDSINAALQGKPGNAGISAARFLVNSTVGLFGIFDVASEIGLTQVDEDFGQTLGVWGADDGAYLMFPGYGPSTVRNISGDVVDGFAIPSIALSLPQTILRYTIKGLEARASLFPQEALLNESLDPYIFVKEVYLQRQLFELYDGNPPLEEDDEEFDEDFLEELE